jgi:hypothetical protein
MESSSGRPLNLVWLLAILAILAWAAAPRAAAVPQLRNADRIRLAEARRLAQQIREQVWSGWSAAPFVVLLVTSEHEFLLWHPRPSDDFSWAGHDSLLDTNVYYRTTNHPLHLLATFPAVGAVPTIVVGQPENTPAKTSTPWVVTLLHEHFHQWQDSQPGIFQEMEALGLSGGDQTGMWMLNYAFPYEDPAVQERFRKLCRALLAALDARSTGAFPRRVAEYLRARKQFATELAQNDYKYFSFQLWKEGVARYTELRVAELAARKYQPSNEFARLADYTRFADVATRLFKDIRTELAVPALASRKRVSFYAVGAGEALLLDAYQPDWKQHYLQEKFFLERYFENECCQPGAEASS